MRTHRRPIADSVSDAASETAARVEDVFEDATDKAAEATGWLARLLKRIAFIALMPLWLALVLFGCGPLS